MSFAAGATALTAQAIAWIHGAGFWGPVVFATLYIVATIFLLPGSLLGIGAGFVYGPLWGTLLVSPVSVVAATASFSIAHGFGRSRIAQRVARDPRFSALDGAIGNSGFYLVLLLRMSPWLPFGLLNYALGLTRVPLKHYVWGSWIGMLPATAMYVYLGSLVPHLTELSSIGAKDAGPWAQGVYWLGLAATVGVSVLLTRMARTALKPIMKNANS